MSNSPKNAFIRTCFYIAWPAVCVLQASFTELLADEAYYWKYAQGLAWGYFDHPPAVAALIKAGYSLLHNELGVRLFFIFSSIALVYLLELLTRPRNILLFYLSVASIGGFHFLGFLALPDMPLLLFTASFLYLYRIYLRKDGWGVSLLLAANATLLLLSKYHGVLVIGFAILSNLQLLKRKTFWLIAALSLNLFIPHIQWQAAHDFPSVTYHLYERSAEPYKIDFTLNYLLSVLLMFSPAVGLVFAWHTIRGAATDGFGRALKWMTAGTLIFFFIMTFKGRGEGNWVAFALIPAFVMGYRRCEQKDWFPKFTRTSFIVSVCLITALRVYLMYDFLPDNKVFSYAKETFHDTKKWAEAIHERAGERPVAFMNKYQYAAWYEYYTGQPAISLNNRMGRKNQYNIWPDEKELQGKNIMLVPNYEVRELDTIATAKGVYQYCYIDNFRSALPIRIVPGESEIKAAPGEVFQVNFIINTTDKEWTVEDNEHYAAVLHSLVFEEDKLVQDESREFYLRDAMANSGEVYFVTVAAPGEPGDYSLYLDVAMGWLPPAINGTKIKLKVQ